MKKADNQQVLECCLAQISTNLQKNQFCKFSRVLCLIYGQFCLQKVQLRLSENDIGNLTQFVSINTTVEIRLCSLQVFLLRIFDSGFKSLLR